MNIQDNDGWTALHWASQNGETEIVKCLVDAGAELDLQIWNGSTALNLASSGGRRKIMNILSFDRDPYKYRGHY